MGELLGPGRPQIRKRALKQKLSLRPRDLFNAKYRQIDNSKAGSLGREITAHVTKVRSLRPF